MSRTAFSRRTPDVSVARFPPLEGVLALTGAGMFAALVILLHFVEKDFRPCCRFVSEYALGDRGWLMNLAFLSIAVALLSVAHGLRRSLLPGRRVTATIRLMYVGASTTILSGLFNSDSLADSEANRESWHGLIHDLSGFLGFVCLTLASFLLRGVFARDTQWRRFAPCALLFATTMLVLFALVLFAPTDSFGVAQRAFITVTFLWIGTLGCALLTAESASTPSGPPSRTTATLERTPHETP